MKMPSVSSAFEKIRLIIAILILIPFRPAK
jgi:hypothetical protein